MKRYGLDDISTSVEDCIIRSANDDRVSAYLYNLWTLFDRKNVMPENFGGNDVWQFHQDVFDICHTYERELEKQKREEQQKQ